MTDQRYSISFVAQRFGLRVSALRYYDRIGLLPAAERKGNVRYYGRAELRRLALIQQLHQQGLLSLDDTARLLADEPKRVSATWHEVLATTAEALHERIRQLQGAHKTLEHLLTCPDQDPIRDCPHLDGQLDDAVDSALGDA